MSDIPKPPPDAASLHEAALAHLTRYATTRAGLLRVLDHKILRWVRLGGDAAAAAAAKQAARAVVDRLAAAGLVDDATFAEIRARSLTRAGRSRRAVAAHLRARGVDGDLADAAAPEDAEADYAAALMYARRRRMGPFRATDGDSAVWQKELAAMARSGFSQETARRALATEREAAEDVIIRLKQA